jgi:lysozyme family protein
MEDFDRFTKFIKFVLERECAYAKGSQERIPEDVVYENVPGDSGGVTKYGVDQRSHPGVDIKNLTLEQAEKIYYQEWLTHQCDKLSSPVAEVVYDAFVTGGHPINWLQEVLNIKSDGFIGPVTIATANNSDHLVTANKILVKRDSYFMSIANASSHNRQFLSGWINRDTKLKEFIRTLV